MAEMLLDCRNEMDAKATQEDADEKTTKKEIGTKKQKSVDKITKTMLQLNAANDAAVHACVSEHVPECQSLDEQQQL